ncbi:MAG TPA: NADP-dependent oxidoreductase [Acidimicrobiales bacterium]|nr:NADP-dependent oxidoreductase [Acidimicrobiales bacterium]
MSTSVQRSDNEGVVLRRRPIGLLRHEDVEIVPLPLPEPPPGGFVLRTDRIGIDATVRSWLQAGEGYFPAVEIGEVVRSSGIGRVVATDSPNFREGDVVTALTGWQRYVALNDDILSTNVGRPETVDQPAHMAVYGSAGMTAYIGMLEVGQAKRGDRVLVSAAAGATGSIAAQLAKLQGATVIGLASSDKKCQWLVDELGLDDAVNYRTGDVPASLKRHFPKGIDVYFDNVGGPLLDLALARIANSGRVVLCGAISSYNDQHRPPGPSNYLNLIHRQASMQGFLTLNHWDRFGDIQPILEDLVTSGALKFRIEVFEGLESAVDALNAMFTGRNIGKIVIEL